MSAGAAADLRQEDRGRVERRGRWRAWASQGPGLRLAGPEDRRAVLLLVRLALRRDRILLTAWAAVLTALCLVSALSVRLLYVDTTTVEATSAVLDDTPAVVALYGPVLVAGSVGELAMAKLTVLYAVAVALLAVVVVRRHTRAEEEEGRAELVGAGAVPRWAGLAAAVTVAAGTSVVVGVLAAAADVAGGLPVAGSLLFGAGWAGIGLIGTGMGALACQLSSSARTCLGAAAGGVLGLYLLRAVGDTVVTGLSWATPFGWSTRLLAWSDHPRWWLLVADLAVAGGLVAAAALLQARRDLGTGVLPTRAGPATGSPRLRGAWSLAWRSHRAGLLGWSVGTLVLSVLMGAMVPSVGGLLDSAGARAAVAQLGGVGALEDMVVGALLGVVAVVVTGYALSVAASAATEELRGRTGLVLAAPVGRRRCGGATAAVALLGATWLLVLTGVGLAISLAVAGTALGRDPASVLGAALVRSPAVWLTAAAGLLVVAAWPRAAGAVWAPLVLFVLAEQVGALPGVPAAVAWASPFSHVPAMPAEPFDLAASTGLVLLTAALLTLAARVYHRRDIGG